VILIHGVRAWCCFSVTLGRDVKQQQQHRQWQWQHRSLPGAHHRLCSCMPVGASGAE
jgi:hypothetical protein